jgi:hypothetical protein
MWRQIVYKDNGVIAGLWSTNHLVKVQSSFLGSNAVTELPLYRPNWISLYAGKFYPRDFVHYGFQDDDLPLFGKIREVIVLAGSTCLFELDVYNTKGINSHVASYQVLRTNHTAVVLLSHIDDKRSYYAHTYLGDSRQYITMRSYTPPNLNWLLIAIKMTFNNIHLCYYKVVTCE